MTPLVPSRERISGRDFGDKLFLHLEISADFFCCFEFVGSEPDP